MTYFELYGFHFEIKDKGSHLAKRGMDENELWTEIQKQLQDPELIKQFVSLEEAKTYAERIGLRRVWTAARKSFLKKVPMVCGYCLYIEEAVRDEDMEWLDGGDVYSVYVEALPGEEDEDAES